MASIYKSPPGETAIQALYDRFLADLCLEYEERMVDTPFGVTHVLVFGPPEASPVVVTHGGNSINPQGLRGLLPLLQTRRYRVYAPDTIGHPGKSAETRLSSRDDSYGRWLDSVMAGLGLEQAALVGGSFGAGIILRLMAHAPRRVSRAALFVPSGIVSVPLRSMLFRIGLPYVLYLLSPSPARLRSAVAWMGNEIDDDVLELISAVFQHVRVEADMPRPATRAELAECRAPTLILAGEKDAMFPGDAVVRRAREIIPNLVAAECLPGATHFSGCRDTAYVNRRIQEFLAGE